MDFRLPGFAANGTTSAMRLTLIRTARRPLPWQSDPDVRCRGGCSGDWVRRAPAESRRSRPWPAGAYAGRTPASCGTSPMTWSRPWPAGADAGRLPVSRCRMRSGAKPSDPPPMTQSPKLGSPCILTACTIAKSVPPSRAATSGLSPQPFHERILGDGGRRHARRAASGRPCRGLRPCDFPDSTDVGAIAGWVEAVARVVIMLIGRGKAG